MAALIANQLQDGEFSTQWPNQVINANTQAVLMKWQEFRHVPRPLLPIVYIVVPEQDETIPDNEMPNEPKVKIVRLVASIGSDANARQRQEQLQQAIHQARREHDRMTKLKMLLRQLRHLIADNGVRSVDDLVSACKGYDTESEQLGYAAQRRRNPEIFRPMPDATPLPEGCEQQLAMAQIDLIAHDALRVGSMPLRLSFPDAQNNYANMNTLNDDQKNARVIKLVNDPSPKADELRLSSNVAQVSAQEVYAILPPNPQLNNGYAVAVLDGLDQLNYARYMMDAQGAEALQPGSRVQSLETLYNAVRELLTEVPHSQGRRP